MLAQRLTRRSVLREALLKRPLRTEGRVGCRDQQTQGRGIHKRHTMGSPASGPNTRDAPRFAGPCRQDLAEHLFARPSSEQ